MTTSRFWTILLVLLLFIGSCLAMTGCGKSHKDVYDEPIAPTATTWDNGSITYWENLETEDIIVEEIEGIIVNEITIE